MSWTANIQGSYGANTMTVSWSGLSDVPTKYTVTAQPGNFSSEVSGSSTSTTFSTPLSGVAYNVRIVPDYTGTTASGSVYGKKVIVTGSFNVNVGINFTQPGWNGIIFHINGQPTANSNIVLFNNNDGTSWGPSQQSATFTNLGITNSATPSSFMIDFTTPSSIKVCKLDGTVVITFPNPYTAYTPTSYASSTLTVRYYVDPVSATLVSPPAALAVPLTTDVAPWLWYDAADPTTVRCNSSGGVSEWYNKGTSAGSTNANATISGAVSYGSTNINNVPVVSCPTGTKIITPSITATSQSFSFFTVFKPTATGRNFLLFPSTSGAPTTNGTPLVVVNETASGNIQVGNQNLDWRTITAQPISQNSLNLLSAQLSTTTANNFIALNGSTLTLTTNTASSGLPTNVAATYDINWNNANDFGEIIMYMGDITATHRVQIEGYLAWKWGLQAQLPATHPFSTVNMASSMAAYVRPRMYVSTFSDISAGGTMLRGLAIDSAGNMYTGSGSAIVKITPAGVASNFITTGGNQNRTGVAVDSAGNIFVHERNAPAGTGTVRKFNSAGVQQWTATIPAYGFGMFVDNSGNAYSYTDTNVMYKISPSGTLSTNPFAGKVGPLAFDSSNNAYILNYSDCKLYKVSADGNTTTFIAGSGTTATVDGIGAGASFGLYYSPGMWVDSATGNIYIAEYNCVRIVTPGGVVRTIAGSTSNATGFTNGLDMNARFYGVGGGILEGIVRDSAGNFYVIDSTNAAVRKLALGTLNQIATFASDTSTYQATGDAFGNIYLGTYSGYAVRKITPTGSVSTFVGTGSTGSANGAGTAASFTSANGIVRDELGNFYVAEHAGNRIRKVSPAGLVTTFASVTSPLGLTMGPDNNIYAACHGDHTIYRITRAGVVSLYAGASGQPAATDNVSRLSARFHYPCGVAFYNGNMYVADGTNNKIRKIDASGIVTTFAGSGSGTDSNGTGTGAGVASPHGISIDNNGNLYVTGWASTRVCKITQDAVVSTVVSGISNQSYSFIDSAQNLWVSEAATGVRHVAINAIPSGSVSITGTLTQGQTITANTSALVDSDGLGSFSYVWSSSPSAGGVYTVIGSGATLTLAEAQVGKFIKVVVSYTDGRGSAEAVSSSVVGSIVNVNDTAVGLTISGSFIRGQTLTAVTTNIVDPDGNAPPYTYRWSSSTLPSSGFVDISGATASTYVLTTADIGRYIRLTVSYTNNYGSADSAVATSASAVIHDNTIVSGTLDISGNLREDAIVRAVANLVDPDGFGPLTYTWSTSASANGVFSTDASGVDLSGITLSFGQTARFLRVEVRYVDLKGNAENMISTVVGPIVAHTAPSAPTIGNANAGITSVSLSWSTPASNGGLPINGYEIRDENGNVVKSVDASANSTTISDLLPNVARRFTVVALNQRGVSAASAQTAVLTPTAPPVAALATGAISEVINVPIVVGGVEAVAKKLTPAVAADGKKTVSYDPEPGAKTAVAVAGLPATVEKVVIATAAPQDSRYFNYTTLKIAAFDSANQSVSNFSSAPITITLNVPGYTAASLLVRTFDEVGGAVRDTVTATRNPNGSYTMTLSHLTYLRISENVECFVAGTKVLTAAGYKAVEDIVDGELMATADGRALPCKIYRTEIYKTTKDNAPITIPANTFAPRCPAADLTLSPLHAIQIRKDVWQLPKMAAALYKGVRQESVGAACTYYHLEMPNYLTDNIVAEGTVVESYGARQLAGRCVEYKFSGAAGGFIRIVKDKKRAVAASR